MTQQDWIDAAHAKGHLWGSIIAYSGPIALLYWAPWIWEYHTVAGLALVAGSFALCAWLPGMAGDWMARRQARSDASVDLKK